MEIQAIYYFAALIALIGTGVLAYGKMSSKDKEKELRISFLEENLKDSKRTVEKVFEKIDYMQNTISAMRVDIAKISK